tara:strand:- start:27 stop:272 length:246 start_codon:yes stop_codon:yes gene_type:complete
MSAKGTVLKRVRQSRKSNARNKHYKSAMKTSIKNALNNSTDESAVKDAISITDKVKSKGMIHKNKASRIKSRLMKQSNKGS